MIYSFPFEWITPLLFFLAYNRVEYGIPVDVEALDMESNLVDSSPANNTVIGDPKDHRFESKHSF